MYVYGCREEGPLGGGMRVVVYNKEAGPPGRYFEQHVSGPLVLFVGDGEVAINLVGTLLLCCSRCSRE